MAKGRAKARAKAPAAVLKDVEQRLVAGWPAGLTVLSGDDLYHLDQAQRMLLAALVPAEATEFGLTVFEDKTRVSEIVAAARSVGMFSPRRVVFVRDVAVFEGEPDGLIDYAKAPPPSSHLIVRAVQLDQRFKLHKALAQHGDLYPFEQGGQDLRTAMSSIKALADRRKVKLTRDALAWVADACGGDLYRATQELDKLAAWQAPSADGADAPEPIELDVARALVIGSEQATAFEVADAIMTRDRGRALAALRTLLANDEPPLKILGGLGWQLRALVTAKSLIARRTPMREAVRAAGAWRFEEQLTAGLRRYSLEEILALPELLRATDRALKGSAVPDAAVLEQLIEQMTSETTMRAT